MFHVLDVLVIHWWERHGEFGVRLSGDVQLGLLNQDEWCRSGNDTVSWFAIRAVLTGHPELICGVGFQPGNKDPQLLGVHVHPLAIVLNLKGEFRAGQDLKKKTDFGIGSVMRKVFLGRTLLSTHCAFVR